MEKMTCPICGEKFDEKDMDFLENGNPACSKCVEKEQSKNKTTSNTKPSKKFAEIAKPNFPLNKTFARDAEKNTFLLFAASVKTKSQPQQNFALPVVTKQDLKRKRKKEKLLQSLQ